MHFLHTSNNFRMTIRLIRNATTLCYANSSNFYNKFQIWNKVPLFKYISYHFAFIIAYQHDTELESATIITRLADFNLRNLYKAQNNVSLAFLWTMFFQKTNKKRRACFVPFFGIPHIASKTSISLNGIHLYKKCHKHRNTSLDDLFLKVWCVPRQGMSLLCSATVKSRPNPSVGATEAPSGRPASFIIRLMYIITWTWMLNVPRHRKYLKAKILRHISIRI